MQAKQIKKLYYSIGEVSDLTGLKQYVLRYWETEFTILNPAKNRAGKDGIVFPISIDTSMSLFSILDENSMSLSEATAASNSEAKAALLKKWREVKGNEEEGCEESHSRCQETGREGGSDTDTTD